MPRNRALRRHVARVIRLVSDRRATQYWDEYEAVVDPYDDMLDLTGPCAGIFMLFDAEVVWGDDGPPEPTYYEDAHAREYDRAGPQFNAKRFAAKVKTALN